MPKSVSDILREISAFTEKNETPEIICLVCGCKKSDIYLNNFFVSENQKEKIEKIITLRKSGKPLAYCVNSAYFYDREFFVNENVLIPRFDTEILIETVLKNENSNEQFVLELGTGSGIVCEILQSERQNWNIVSVDISRNALSVAKKNCQDKILLVNSDRFGAILSQNQFDIIVSNPPYIESKTIDTLDESVKNFEPRIALDGGESGLEFYEYMAKSAKYYLKDGGRIYVETGFNQGESVPLIFRENGFVDIKIIRDLGDNSRVVSAKIF